MRLSNLICSTVLQFSSALWLFPLLGARLFLGRKYSIHIFEHLKRFWINVVCWGLFIPIFIWWLRSLVRELPLLSDLPYLVQFPLWMVLMWSWGDESIHFFSFITSGFLNPPNYLLAFTHISKMHHPFFLVCFNYRKKMFFQVSHFLSHIANPSSVMNYQVPNYFKYFGIYCCSFIFLG